MVRKLLAVFLWNIIQQCLASTFESRDTVFSLYPPHVWYGEVKARQIGTGGLSLCADESWSLAEADEVCRDLGFQKGALQLGTQPLRMKAETTAKCLFVPEGSFCQINDNFCSMGAWVSCQFPAYIGCYPFDPQMPSFVTYERLRGDIDEMAIEICTNMCYENGYDYAGLEDGSRCYCGNNPPFLTTQSERTQCLKPCNDDDRQSCGGVGHIAIYESKLGRCNETFITRDTDFYLASPGFPGLYRADTTCLWTFATPKFNDTLVTIFGMDFTEAESLTLISYETVTTATTSKKVFTSTGQHDVRRGVFKLDIRPNSINAGIVVIFNVTGNSGGAKQFLVSFRVTNVSVPTPPSTATVTATAATKKTNSGRRHVASSYVQVVAFLLALTIFRRGSPSFS